MINVRLVLTLSYINSKMNALKMTPINKAGHVKIQGIGQLIWQPTLMLPSPAGNRQGMALQSTAAHSPACGDLKGSSVHFQYLCTKYLGC